MKTIIRSSVLAAIVLASGFALLAVSYSAAHAARGGNGNHFGWGNGNGVPGGGRGGGGGGGGGPLPLLGATVLGQAAGAAGLYVLWRRRRQSRKTGGQEL